MRRIYLLSMDFFYVIKSKDSFCCHFYVLIFFYSFANRRTCSPQATNRYIFNVDNKQLYVYIDTKIILSEMFWARPWSPLNSDFALLKKNLEVVRKIKRAVANDFEGHAINYLRCVWLSWIIAWIKESIGIYLLLERTVQCFERDPTDPRNKRQCWLNAGPSSATLAQHYTNNCSINVLCLLGECRYLEAMWKVNRCSLTGTLAKIKKIPHKRGKLNTKKGHVLLSWYTVMSEEQVNMTYRLYGWYSSKQVSTSLDELYKQLGEKML